MKNKAFFLAILAILAILAGCRAPKPLVVERVVTTTTVVDRWHDSVIEVLVPYDSVVLVLSDTDTSYLSTELARSVAWAANGELHHELIQLDKPIQALIQWRDREVIINRDSLVINTVTIEVERKLTAWQSIAILVGKIVLGASPFLIAFMLLKSRIL